MMVIMNMCLKRQGGILVQRTHKRCSTLELLPNWSIKQVLFCQKMLANILWWFFLFLQFSKSVCLLAFFGGNYKMHAHFETFIYHTSLPNIFSAMHSPWLTKINRQNVISLKNPIRRSSNVLHLLCIRWTKFPPCSHRPIWWAEIS